MVVWPTYVCRACEPQGHDPQVARAVLPPEPILKSGIGSGLLAHVIVAKLIDHLLLHRQETILAHHGWEGATVHPWRPPAEVRRPADAGRPKQVASMPRETK